MQEYSSWDEYFASNPCGALSAAAFPTYGIILVGSFPQDASGICISCLAIHWQESRNLSPATPYRGMDSFTHEIDACFMKLKGADVDAFFVIQMASRRITRSRYLPSGLCQHSKQAQVHRPLDSNRLIRRKDLLEIKSNEMLYDVNFGPLKALPATEFSVSKQVSVASPGFDGPVLGLGKSFMSRSAAKVAELEALERYCSLDNRSQEEGPLSSYRNLGREALHPSVIGLYRADQYAVSDFPCRPFDADEVISWKLLRSLDDKRFYVPEEMIYFGMHVPGLPLVLETSNGCSLGSTRDEAIAFGALELIERDSILRAFYGQIPPKRIMAKAYNFDAGLEIDWLGQRSYDVYSFEVSSVSGISVVLHFGISRSDQNAQVISSSAADWSQSSAYHRGLQELCSQADWGSQLNDTERLRAQYLAAHPGSLRAGVISDHMLLFAHVSSKKYLQSFLQAELFVDEPACTEAPTLHSLVGALARHDLSLLFADLTAAELAPQDLVCMRTVIPGLLPIFYGCGMERIPAGCPLIIDRHQPHPFS